MNGQTNESSIIYGYLSALKFEVSAGTLIVSSLIFHKTSITPSLFDLSCRLASCKRVRDGMMDVVIE